MLEASALLSRSEASWLHRYVLVTPMVSEQWGTAALVMRGWVPDSWRSDPAARAPYQPSGQVLLFATVNAGG